tara:strand:- start:174 stop:431 length:258 start_codon:yes stop_codon:yes gene_type:complete
MNTAATIYSEALALLNSNASDYEMYIWMNRTDTEAVCCADTSCHGENAQDLFQEENGRLPETDMERAIVDLSGVIESINCDMTHE